MTFLRYQRWPLLDDIHRGFDRTLNVPFGASSYDEPSSGVAGNWTPSVDIKEEQDRFVLYADLPGVDVKDIDITMEKGVLALKGERHGQKSAGSSDYRRTERSRGAFYRRFSLPDSIDEEGIAARTQNGVLEVVIPKRVKVQPRRINVES